MRSSILDFLEENEKCAELLKKYEETRNLEPEVAMVTQIKSYGTRTVIRDLNFILKQKECFGLVGMNSTGKSTIFKMLMGEISVAQGDAVIQQYKLTKNTDEFLGLIGYCPQYGGLNDYLTGRQNLVFFAAIRGVPFQNIRREVDKWIDIFDLLDFENMKIGKCGMGLQQKICLLQSLIGDLPILCLDDPSAGIDILAQYALREVLNHVREMGRSLLITTHNTQDVEPLSSRVGILLDGSFVEIGTCEDLKNIYGNTLTLNIKLNPERRRSSIDGIEFMKRDIIETIPGIVFKDQTLQGIVTYEIPGNIAYSNIFLLVKKLMQKHSTIQDFSLNQTTLEQVFLELSKNVESSLVKKATFYLRICKWIMRIIRCFLPICRFLCPCRNFFLSKIRNRFE